MPFLMFICNVFAFHAKVLYKLYKLHSDKAVFSPQFKQSITDLYKEMDYVETMFCIVHCWNS